MHGVSLFIERALDGPQMRAAAVREGWEAWRLRTSIPWLGGCLHVGPSPRRVKSGIRIEPNAILPHSHCVRIVRAVGSAMVSNDVQAAVEAATLGGRVVLDHRAGPPGSATLKADRTPITEADVAAHWAVVTLLRTRFPNDTVISEEDPRTSTLLEGRTWVVDPLDGTRDFLACTGEWCVHVGLVVDGTPQVGVVHQPVTGAVWWAQRGHGAFMEHAGLRSPLSVSTTTELSHARIGVSRTNLTPPMRRFLDAHQLWPNARPMGASTKLMALARGDLDAVINLSSLEMPWDTCAPAVILAEAGGAYSGGDGAPFSWRGDVAPALRGTLATNGRLHAPLLSALEAFLP